MPTQAPRSGARMYVQKSVQLFYPLNEEGSLKHRFCSKAGHDVTVLQRAGFELISSKRKLFCVCVSPSCPLVRVKIGIFSKDILKRQEKHVVGPSVPGWPGSEVSP